ncbi:MAG: hypothetical protein GX787_02530 [Tissierellia bacterium]|jgi:hypothetical protein|nr:hypothetical protein [Tissierellia bacterium]
MFGKGKKMSALLLAIILILSQSMIFAETVKEQVVVITGVGVTELKLTLEDLKAMPAEAQIEDDYIYNSKTGEKTVAVKGVSLAYLLVEKAGLTAENAEVNFTAADGYAIDPQLLKDILNEDLKYVLAYEADGEAIVDKNNPDNELITVYRKVKEEGEFNTVFKFVNKIELGEATEEVEEPEVDTEEPVEVDIVFTDITEEYKYAEMAISELAKKGIINGMGNGLYAPEGEFTRAQFCKIVVESLGIEQVDYKAGFTDVKSADWFAKYVQAAVDAELFEGYPEGDFMPNKVITRQEMAVVVARAAVQADKVKQEKVDKFTMDKSEFEDKAEVPDWAEHAVAWLEAEGAFSDIANENFNPTKVVNRAEAATVVYNTLFK